MQYAVTALAGVRKIRVLAYAATNRLNTVVTVLGLCVLACLPLCGAELPEAPEGTFSVVVIPDTQHYQRLKQDDQAWENPTFEAYASWIAANIERQRIVFVSHVGDIVDLNERPQCMSASPALTIL